MCPDWQFSTSKLRTPQATKSTTHIAGSATLLSRQAMSAEPDELDQLL